MIFVDAFRDAYLCARHDTSLSACAEIFLDAFYKTRKPIALVHITNHELEKAYFDPFVSGMKFCEC